MSSDGHGGGSGGAWPGGGSPSDIKCHTDNVFKKVEDYITKSIQSFVAFLFILVSIGAVIGYLVAQKPGSEWLVLVPAAAGLIAYYNRDFAVLVLGTLVLIVLL